MSNQRGGLAVCGKCGLRYRKGNLRHQDSAACAFEVARLEASRRGWWLSGQYTTSIRLAGFDVRRLDCREQSPIARVEVVSAAATVSSAFTFVDYGAWRRHAMIRLLVREPERGPALIAIARLGGEFPLEWLPPGERRKPKWNSLPEFVGQMDIYF